MKPNKKTGQQRREQKTGRQSAGNPRTVAGAMVALEASLGLGWGRAATWTLRVEGRGTTTTGAGRGAAPFLSTLAGAGARRLPRFIVVGLYLVLLFWVDWCWWSLKASLLKSRLPAFRAPVSPSSPSLLSPLYTETLSPPDIGFRYTLTH